MRKSFFGIIGIAMIIGGFVLIAISAYFTNVMLLVIGIFILLVSIIFTFFILSFQLFSQDKNLDLESLKLSGLTIVECANCQKENVLEDQYCIYCGEKLGESDEQIS